MKKNLITRIEKSNRLIMDTIQNDYAVTLYFGGTWPIKMKFTKPISITKTFIILTYIDLQSQLQKRDLYKIDNTWDISDLRYTLTCINRAIKNHPSYIGQ